MKKDILVGSLFAVIILISVSFTSVIGYTTIKSVSMSASPLFEVRTKWAIGEQRTGIHHQYISKENTLWFPKRDDKAMVTQKIVDSIRNMDDMTFEKFISSIILSLQKNGRLNGINSDEIKDALYQAKHNKEPVLMYNDGSNNITFGYGFKGVLGCMFTLYLFIFNILFNIGFLFYCLATIFFPNPDTRVCQVTCTCTL